MKYFSSGIEECIRNITFSYDETLMYGSIGMPASPSVELKNLTFWNSTVPVSYHGMCHTLIYPSLVAADTTSDAVYLALDTGLREGFKNSSSIDKWNRPLNFIPTTH